MKPEDIVELFTAGIILVVGGLVIATIAAPQIADVLDNVVVQIVSALVYAMVGAIIIVMFYRILSEI